MVTATAIIGSNWGDEGKGLGTDALAFDLGRTGQPVVVVRSNGGAQAGHGVERPDGRRHVFHHVGSGTFAGAGTHLSQFFVAHPMMLEAELADLASLSAPPSSITIDPRAPVTTPWDMAINQALEIARDGARHGSTGLGFGETIERDETGPRLRAGDLWQSGLADRLRDIRDKWMPARRDALGIDPEASPLADILTGRVDLVGRFEEDCMRFRTNVSLLDDAQVGARGSVLFEGAQGLQLDMVFGVFPHVTRSYTGVRNMLKIAAEAGINEICPLYMTRSYATRHGAGPLPFETPGATGLGEIDFAEVVDLTNAPNDWQGVIRHAALDIDLLADTVACDLALAKDTDIRVTPALGVTCLDQLKGLAEIHVDGALVRVSEGELLSHLAQRTGLAVALESRGPCREDVSLKRVNKDRLAA